MQPLALIVLASALLGGSVTNNQTKLDANENNDVLEAVFRHVARPKPKEMEGSHSLNLIHHVYFIAFWGSDVKYKDPNPSLLERFHDFPVPVKPLSAASMRDFCAYDKATGERGAVFYFQEIRRTGRHKAEVTVGLAPGGGLTGSTYRYRVVQRQGSWIVTGEK